jgi:hypothetical protein
MKRDALILLFFLAISALAIAADPTANVNDAVFFFCNGLMGILPVVLMILVVFAGVIYASGQIMGAETRARANVWATAALAGALIATLIYAIAPGVLSAIMGQPVNCTAFVP